MLGGEFAEAQNRFVREIVAQEMGLVIEDELTGESIGALEHHIGLAGFRFANAEGIGAVNLAHRQECGGHATAGLQELAPRHAKIFGVLIGQFLDPLFNLLLFRRLFWRKIFAIGNDLSRNR